MLDVAPFRRTVATTTLAAAGVSGAWAMAAATPDPAPGQAERASARPPLASLALPTTNVPAAMHPERETTFTPSSVSPGERVAPTPAVPPRCPNELQLTATLHHDARPERSFALLRTSGSKRGALYRAGMPILGYSVAVIGSHGVLMRSGRGHCFLPMTGAPPPPALTSSDASAGVFSARVLERGIQRLAPGRYRVDRALLMQAASRFSALARESGLRATERRKHNAGLRLDRVAEGGLFQRLGLRAGDVLTAVGDRSLVANDAEHHLRGVLRAGRSFKLQYQHRGRKATLDLRVR